MENSNGFRHKGEFNPKVQRLFEEEAARMNGLNPSKEKKKWTLLKVMAYCIGLIGGVIISAAVIAPFLAYSILAHAFVGMKLWQWFVVPLGLVPLTLWKAAGIMTLIRLCTYQFMPSTNTDEKKKWTQFVLLVLTPWCMLLVGYIIHCFV
jgi:hypothetical protein